MLFKKHLCFALISSIVMLFVLSNILSANDTQNLSPSPVQSLSVSTNSGTFEFGLSPLGMKSTKFTISIRSCAKKQNGLVSIDDEANALAQFFDQISKSGIDLKNISYIYLPSTNEKEVQERLMIAAEQSEAWLQRGKTGNSKTVADLLMLSQVYREIDAILHVNGLRLDRISVENILVKKALSGDNTMVPYNTTTYLQLSPSNAGN